MGDGPVVWAEGGAGCRHPSLFPKEGVVKRVDDRKVLSGIIHGTQRGLRWVGASA